MVLRQISVVFYPVASVVHLIAGNSQCFEIKMNLGLHVRCRGKELFFVAVFFFCLSFFYFFFNLLRIGMLLSLFGVYASS